MGENPVTHNCKGRERHTFILHTHTRGSKLKSMINHLLMTVIQKGIITE